MRSGATRLLAGSTAAAIAAATLTAIVPASQAAAPTSAAAADSSWNSPTTVVYTCGPNKAAFTATVTYTSTPVDAATSTHSFAATNPSGGVIDSVAVWPRNPALIAAPYKPVTTPTSWSLTVPDALVKPTPGASVLVYYRPSNGGGLTKCFIAGGVKLTVRDPQQRPTPSEAAGTLYAQSMGMNLGKTAAVLAIAVGVLESGLNNSTVGDMRVDGNGMTSSRGIFQLMSFWAPPTTAWSGQKAPSSELSDFSQFNNSNAWGSAGWATGDPRMSAAQSANLFLLGAARKSSVGGLEDNARFYALRKTDPDKIKDTTLAQIIIQVTGVPVSMSASVTAAVVQARAIYKEIQAKTIPTPSFTKPLPSMAIAASTPETKAVFGKR